MRDFAQKSIIRHELYEYTLRQTVERHSARLDLGLEVIEVRMLLQPLVVFSERGALAEIFDADIVLGVEHRRYELVLDISALVLAEGFPVLFVNGDHIQTNVFMMLVIPRIRSSRDRLSRSSEQVAVHVEIIIRDGVAKHRDVYIQLHIDVEMLFGQLEISAPEHLRL